MNKTAYVIAGPNGAGKTTFALQYLKDITGCDNFINADMLAYGLNPINQYNAQLQAGKLFLMELENHITKGDSFAFETTLSGRIYIKLLKRLREENWRIVMFFLWIPGPDYSFQRVKERVRQGGHDIPEKIIRRRYPRLIKNFKEIYYHLCDEIFCYDNSGMTPKRIFYKNINNETEVENQLIFNKIIGQ
ncbi:MAG: zeta toxin family protein [Phycisphaerae bacterium]|nr:zeta toxin family protein [Phycisphaerae bacterium]